jgi:hypothetical protein
VEAFGYHEAHSTTLQNPVNKPDLETAELSKRSSE